MRSRHSRNEIFSYWFFADLMPQIVAAQLRSLVFYNSIFVSNIGVWVCLYVHTFCTNTNNPYLCILLSSSHRNNHNDVDLYLLRVNSSWNVFFSSANNRLRPYKVHFLRNVYNICTLLSWYIKIGGLNNRKLTNESECASIIISVYVIMFCQKVYMVTALTRMTPILFACF